MLPYFHRLRVLVWTGEKIRMEASFFRKRKKFSIFKNIRVRVDEVTKRGIYKKVMRRGVGVSAVYLYMFLGSLCDIVLFFLASMYFFFWL